MTIAARFQAFAFERRLAHRYEEEERREREHVAKLQELKKEIGGLSSSQAYREFLMERGGRLPHFLLNLEEKDDPSSPRRGKVSSAESNAHITNPRSSTRTDTQTRARRQSRHSAQTDPA